VWDIRNVIIFSVTVGMFLLAYLILSYFGHQMVPELSLLWALGWALSLYGIFMKWAKARYWIVPFGAGLLIILGFPLLL